MKLTKGASEATQKYMVDGIRYVCENFKERAPGTHSERAAQKYLKGELEQWADKVEMEDFTLHPGAFMGWIWINPTSRRTILCTCLFSSWLP